jgi:hypothetical protein
VYELFEYTKKRASAGPKGQFLSALKDDYFRKFNNEIVAGKPGI